MDDDAESGFDPAAFAASAVALFASHQMSDDAWTTFFPELPRDKPELRTILVRIHQRALLNDPATVTEITEEVEEQFGLAEGTASSRIRQLEKLKLVLRRPGSKKKSARHLIPTARAKEHLLKVGEKYLVFLRVVAKLLRTKTPPPKEKLGPLFEQIDKLTKSSVVDYATEDPAEPTSEHKVPVVEGASDGNSRSPDALLDPATESGSEFDWTKD